MGPIPTLSILLALTSIALGSETSNGSDLAEWAAAMQAGRERYHGAGFSGSELVVTGVCHGSEEPVKLEVDVAGLDQLWLIVDAVPDYHHAQSMWGEALLFDANGEATRVSSMKPSSVEVGWGSLRIDVNIHGGTMRIGSRTFEHGLWAHADSALRFELDGKFTRLETWVGIEADAGEKGGARFIVADRPPRRARVRELLEAIALEYPEQVRLTRRLGAGWMAQRDSLRIERELLAEALGRLGAGRGEFETRSAQLVAAEATPRDPGWLVNLARAEARATAFAGAGERIGLFDPEALERAIRSMRERHGDRYPRAVERIEQLAGYELALPEIVEGLAARRPEALERAEQIVAFQREVLPVLTRRCAGCHDGSEGLADLRGAEWIDDWATHYAGYDAARFAGKFTRSYAELHRLVRRPGIESDMHLWTPLEFHADSTELVQLLEKRHHGVELDDEEWDRLITWIDLNAPFHGYWSDIVGEPACASEMRRGELRVAYANVDEDHEMKPPVQAVEIVPVVPGVIDEGTGGGVAPPEGWPLTAEQAVERQRKADTWKRVVELGDGQTIELVRIPAGSFVMGDADGGTVRMKRLDESFWMSTTEITNAQYALFDPGHDSGVEPRHSYQFGISGYPVDRPGQPVVRVAQ